MSEVKLFEKYAAIGSGPKTLIMLPGLSIKSTLLLAESVAEAYLGVLKDYTIYLFDDRDVSGGEYTIKKRADGVAKIMRELGLSATNVFGASLGGMVGMQLAIDNPDLVKKMILASTSSHPKGHSGEALKKWLKYVEDGEIEKLIYESPFDVYSENTVKNFGDAIRAANAEPTEQEIHVFVAMAKAALHFNCTDKLDEIKCKCFVIGSEGDKVLLPQSSRNLAKKLGCEVYMYGPEFGHAVYDEAPDYKQRMFDFFEK